MRYEDDTAHNLKSICSGGAAQASSEISGEQQILICFDIYFDKQVIYFDKANFSTYDLCINKLLI